MFFGTTPAVLAQYIEKELKRQKPSRILVPFSGNFVFEQVARRALPDAEIHSTDVSIYSRAIGFGLTGKDIRLELKDCIRDDFQFLAEQQHPVGKATLIILMLEISKIIKKKDDIRYYQMLYLDAVRNQKFYFDLIQSKLEKIRETIRMNFYGIDAVKFLEMAKPGDVVLFDPPVSDNNKDYEKEYAYIKNIIDFDEEPYTPLDDEGKNNLLEMLHERGARIYYRTNNRKSNLPNYMKQCYSYKYDWESEYCCYSNADNMLWNNRRQMITETPVNLQVIGKDDIITEDSIIEAFHIPNAIGNHYRMMWVKKAQMLDSGMAFIVKIDGKVAGIYQLGPGVKLGTDLASINSDPAAPTSRYRRLSKLILMLICTKETLKELNEATLWYHTGFTTRVFSNAPSSMKYRGMFSIAKREEDKTSDYKYKIIYQNRKHIYNTRKEALTEWIKKYSDKEN